MHLKAACFPSLAVNVVKFKRMREGYSTFVASSVRDPRSRGDDSGAEPELSG